MLLILKLLWREGVGGGGKEARPSAGVKHFIAKNRPGRGKKLYFSGRKGVKMAAQDM
jgi:hypothetical protein